MPSQFERRDEREPRSSPDCWFYGWLAVFIAGMGVYVLADKTAGAAVLIVGLIGLIALSFKRGVGDLPWWGGLP